MADIWEYTPRQAIAFVRLAEIRKKRNYAELLQVTALAHSGDTKAIKRQLTIWDREQ